MVLGLVAPEATDPPSLTVATSSLIAVLGLVAINGFFVAAEFALVAARRSKLDEMIARGDRGAKTVQTALQHLDRYIAGTQLGITIASLALGWVGEPVFEALLRPFLDWVNVSSIEVRRRIAMVVGFLAITFLHIVVGEQAPKFLAIKNPLPVALWVAQPESTARKRT